MIDSCAALPKLSAQSRPPNVSVKDAVAVAPLAAETMTRYSTGTPSGGSGSMHEAPSARSDATTHVEPSASTRMTSALTAATPVDANCTAIAADAPSPS